MGITVRQADNTSACDSERHSSKTYTLQTSVGGSVCEVWIVALWHGMRKGEECQLAHLSKSARIAANAM